MALFSTRVNFGVGLGNLEFSIPGGELRYKTSVDVEGLDPIPDLLIKNLLHANVSAMEKLYPKIQAVAHGALSPEEAAGQVRFRDA